MSLLVISVIHTNTTLKAPRVLLMGKNMLVLQSDYHILLWNHIRISLVGLIPYSNRTSIINKIHVSSNIRTINNIRDL